MGAEATPIQVQILDKEYLVACPEGERDALLAAARHLDRRMRDVRDSGKVIGTERIAVITALNMTHELLQDQRNREEYAKTVDTGIRRLSEKIRVALQGDNTK